MLPELQQPPPPLLLLLAAADTAQLPGWQPAAARRPVLHNAA
jgi:hypothetical protein